MGSMTLASSDLALALPVDALGTNYIVMDYDGTSGVQANVAEFVVVAILDGTDVTIIPIHDIVGHAAKTPFTTTLDRGQTYLARATGVNSLTGTIISATEKVSVTNGVTGTRIPLNTYQRSHIFEMAQPVKSWGKSIAVANLPERPRGTIYRILASEDNTAVNQNGIAVGTPLSQGGFYETPVLNENVSSKPILVTQYMTGDGRGGPSMGNMIPTDQYQNSYTFTTDVDVSGNVNAFAHYVTIIANVVDVGTLTLDGIPVAVTEFKPIQGSNDFRAAVIKVSAGPHSTSSTKGHGITVEGVGTFSSYLYPAGFQVTTPVPPITPNPIPSNPFTPVCMPALAKSQSSWELKAVDSEDVNGNGTLEPGEDANSNGIIEKGTGIKSVEILSQANVLITVPSTFHPGDSSVVCPAVRVAVGQAGSGSVLVTNMNGKTCTLTVKFDPLNDPYDPVITPDSTNQNIGSNKYQVSDNQPTEDINRKGILDINEDTNHNGVIDGDTGILSVALKQGYTNLQLPGNAVTPGDRSFVVTVSLLNPGQDGIGTLVVTDMYGNTSTQNVHITTGTSKVPVDETPPVLTVLQRGENYWSMKATDDRPSEDVNGDGILQSTEDINGNGKIDQDTGMQKVELALGYTNLQLIVPPFAPRQGSVPFTVNQVDVGQVGSGTVVATDFNGNESTYPVYFPESKVTVSFNPLCGVVSQGRNVITGWATDTKRNILDRDSGIQSVVLQRGSTNVRLRVTPFTPGDTNVDFTVERASSRRNRGGRGTVIITDLAGNTCRVPVRFTSSHPPRGSKKKSKKRGSHKGHGSHHSKGKMGKMNRALRGISISSDEE